MGEPTYKPEDVKDAMSPVALAVPKAPAPRPAVAIDDRAPTPAEILDPVRPSFDGADTHDVVDAVTGLVTDIYDHMLIPTLEELKPDLAEVEPPHERDGWVVALIALAAEAVASATLGKVGGLAAAKLFGATSEGGEQSIAGELTADATKDAGKSAGLKVGAATERKLGGDSDGRSHGFSGKLVDEFASIQRGHLLAKKSDAVDRLRLLRARAARVNGASMAALDANLKALLENGDLCEWFRQAVTLEWINLVARLSLGRRPQGQATNLPGANASGGWHDAGARGTVQWRAEHDGFVDITVAVGAGGKLSFESAHLANRPGAAEILRGLAGESTATGEDMSLGTVPAFRRIWLKLGDTKLDVNPAFVITPDGALEVNFDDPVLARIGGAGELESATAYDRYDGRDPVERTRRAARATYAMAGAEKIVTLLKPVHMEQLQ